MDLVFSGLGLVQDDEGFEGLGAAGKGGVNIKTGLTKAQQRNRDVIASTVYSKTTLAATASTRYSLFTGTPATLAAGNVSNGVLPSPQSMAVQELSVYTSGIAGAAVTEADLAKLNDAILEIFVASKLMFQGPLSKVGLNGVGKLSTNGSFGMVAGPERKLQLLYPIIIPANTAFEAAITTGPDALTASNVLTLIFYGELTRLVV